MYAVTKLIDFRKGLSWLMKWVQMKVPVAKKVMLKRKIVLISRLERALVITNNIEKYYLVTIREKGAK